MEKEKHGKKIIVMVNTSSGFDIIIYVVVSIYMCVMK